MNAHTRLPYDKLPEPTCVRARERQAAAASELRRLIETWHAETGRTQSTALLVGHQSSQELLRSHPKEWVVEAIIQDLVREPSRLVHLLRTLTGEQAGAGLEPGDIRGLTRAWIAKRRGEVVLAAAE